MIKINLLPLDKRKTERTPLKGAGLMMADAAVFVVVAILVVISVIQITHVNKEIEEEKKTLASLQDAVATHDKLAKEVDRLTRDHTALETVTGTRPFEWSEVFDAVWTVVDKHKRVWLDSIELAEGRQMESKVKQLDPKSSITGVKYGIVLHCHVAGLDVKGMTAFRRDLRENPTISRYFPYLNFDTQWNRMEQREFTERYSLDFEVILLNTGQTEKNTSPATVRK